MDKGHKGQMSDREVTRIALEALERSMEAGMTGIKVDQAIAALRQALEQPEQVNVPEGWKLVPIEPTDAMLSVPVNIDLRECVTPGGVTGLDAVGLFRAWEAMIEAAPQPWDASDMAHRAGGLSMEQDEIVPSDYSGATGDYSGVTGDYMEQEPVAWRQSNGIIEPVYGVTIPIGSPLYTAPPKREWVGLTDEEIQKVAHDMGTIGDLSHDEFDICRAVIAKLKEKNT